MEQLRRTSLLWHALETVVNHSVRESKDKAASLSTNSDGPSTNRSICLLCETNLLDAAVLFLVGLQQAWNQLGVDDLKPVRRPPAASATP